MGDIVWLLRNDCPCNGDIGCAQELCNQAADEIERLKDGEARLRAALRMLYDEMDEYQRINDLSAYNNQVMRQARAALEGPQDRMAKPLERRT